MKYFALKIYKLIVNTQMFFSEVTAQFGNIEKRHLLILVGQYRKIY